MAWHSLPPRNLECEELEALVNDLAIEPDRWLEHVAFREAERHFTSLHRDDFLDIWLMCWRRVDDTGWHDHDVSSGAVRVVSGSLRESRPRIGGAAAEHLYGAGQSFSFGPDHIHRLSGDGEESISIHAYSPPLWRLGQYSISGDGVMRRFSVSYADELRPLEDELVA
jgi:hypothetical protein